MIFAIDIEMAEAFFAIKKLDAAIFESHANRAFAIERDAYAFIENDIVLLRVNSGAEFPREVKPNGAFSVQADTAFERAAAIVDLHSVLHRAVAFHRLNIDSDDLLRFVSGIIAADFEVLRDWRKASTETIFPQIPGESAIKLRASLRGLCCCRRARKVPSYRKA